MIRLTSPTESLCHSLMSNLRAHDRVEVEALGRGTTGAVLWEAVKVAHEAHAVTIDRELVCIFGVQPDGTVWLLGTPLLDRRLITLCKLAPAFINRWLNRFEFLSNITDQRNRRIVMWLRWLGFSFGEPFDLNGHTFLPFALTKARHV